MEDKSEKLVLLRDGDEYSYGRLIMHDKENHVSGTDIRSFGVLGTIEENLLQEKLIIHYKSEEEKNEILSVIPDEFYAKIEKGYYTRDTIVVEFEKQEISAPLYVNKKRDGGYYSRSTVTYKCEDTKEIETISATLKTPELTEKLIDFMANIYEIKSKYAPEKYYDKYDASSHCEFYLKWLVGTGQAKALDKNGEVSLEKYINLIHSRCDNTDYRVRYNGREYDISFGDADSYSYYEKFDGLENDYRDYIERLKKEGEYYLPGTEIPRYKAPKSGIAIVKSDENTYVLADRTNVYKILNGQPIFINSFILTENNEMFYGAGERAKFSKVLHTISKNSQYIEKEILIGYNDEQIMFIHNKGKSLERGLVSSDSIQRFERENREHPVTIFSIGDTIGFIDGNKVRISNENGELSVFEIEEEIKSVDIKNGYVLINGNIVCCGEKDEDKRGLREDIITPLCKKINNPEMIERFMKNSDKILPNSFIENENGCFFIEGLSDEEKLNLYQENGFNELYEKLELIIRERQEAQKEEERRIEDARQKTNEYLKGQVLTKCHIRKNVGTKGKIIEVGNVEFVENNDVVVLYEKQEKGWANGPVYDTGILYVPEVKKKIKTGKLHLDVPEEYMGMIIGSKGSNINFVTEQLKKKGVDVYKIILHSKTKEEMSQITTSSIKDACENAKKSKEI